MANTPYVLDMKVKSNAAIVSALSDNLSLEFNQRFPQPTQENMKDIAQYILQNSADRNMFVDGLTNRIGLTIATSRAYSNNLAMFKKGIMEYGETVQDYYVNLVKAKEFNPVKAQSTVYQLEPPDVEAAFYSVNRRNFYKMSISDEMLRSAFLSENGLYDMITTCIRRMYDSAEVDEFILTKNVISKAIDNGMITPVQIPAFSESTAKQIATIFKTYTNNFKFMSTEFTGLGVANWCPPEDTYMIMTSDFDAAFDVEVLSSAFNMDKAEFLARRVLVDKFPDHPEVKAVLCDRNFFMIFDKLFEFHSENYNSDGLYRQHVLHTWQIYAASPFANCVAFTTEQNTLTSITISAPRNAANIESNSATGTAGENYIFSASVAGSGIVPSGVYWDVSGQKSETYIGYNGRLYIASDETATALTITATSVKNPDITDTFTLNLA